MVSNATTEAANDDRAVPLAPTLVRPVTNALRILRYLSRARGPETVTMISRTLDINTSTCFNILRTLASEGMVAFDERTKSYGLGIGVVQLAQGALSEQGKSEIIRPILQKIADDHGVTVTLWRVAESHRNVLISASQSRSAVQIHMDVGQRLPLYIGAFGRVLAAVNGVPDAALRAEFDAMRWAEPPTPDDYLADVARARQTGWAIDDGHFAVGVASVAVAVRDFNGAVRHGIVASYFRTQLDREAAEALAGDMLARATELQGVL